MAIRTNLPSAESLWRICQMRGASEMRNDNRYYDRREGWGRGKADCDKGEKRKGVEVVWSSGSWTRQKVEGRFLGVGNLN